MTEAEGDDLKEFKPLHERQSWMGEALTAIGVLELVCLVILFGGAGFAYWLFGGAPP